MKNIDDYRVNHAEYGIFFCEDAHNISISGNGTIDGSGSAFYDFTRNHVYDEFVGSKAGKVLYTGRYLFHRWTGRKDIDDGHDGFRRR